MKWKTFETWFNLGGKYATVAAGGKWPYFILDYSVDNKSLLGSIYALIIFAGQDMHISIGQMDGLMHRTLANALRHPDLCTLFLFFFSLFFFF